jgi:hypothetical protein
MPDEERTRLNILARLSNISVKFGKLKKRAAERNRWLEVKKELESLCGTGNESDAELMLRILESRLARDEGRPDPLPSEMTLVKKRRR